jgi:hypothetical protein
MEHTTLTYSANEMPSKQRWLWLVFVLYVVLAAIAMFRHEMWPDELHCWNIAKGSGSLANLIHNNRFEGHPPAWIALLWIISKFTSSPAYMQVAQLCIAVATVYLILFRSPFPTWTKILLPFGYYFLFEYGIISRNYGLGVLFALLICLIIKKEFSGKLLVYYTLLFLMSNVHLLSLLLAGSLHLYFLLWLKERRKGWRVIIMHALIALIVFLPSMWYISAPSGSGPTVAILLSKTAMSQVAIAAQAPVRSYLPIPAWWKYHFWNTQVLLELKDTYRFLKFVVPLCSLLLMGWVCYLLKSNRKSLLLFIANMLANVMVGVVFSLHTERYSGYMFIGFVIAWYLYCSEIRPSSNKNWMVNTLLIVQMIAGIFAVSKDIAFPFSQSQKVADIMQDMPANARVVTDYRALNQTITYCKKPLYCIDMEQTLRFILWNTDMEKFKRYPDRYNHGFQQYFAKENCNEVYMISTGDPEVLKLTDPKLLSSWRVQLVKRVEGSIETGSNIYLYKISRW